jgi:hypothetical protein
MKSIISSIILAVATVAAARDIHVGTDAPNIAAAIKAAQPGDTIHLQPITYHDYAGFYGKKGEPGKPITLDGHGATLEGSDPLDPATWTEVSPGLFKNDNLMRLDDAVIGRWFFVWNGKMNHMGRTSKGKGEPLKPVNELQPGEWTFVKDPSREKPPSRQIYGTFYVKLPPGQKLADANLRAPVRSAGVQMAGENAWLVIKNLTATHPYNDGFNIHGDCRDVVFENIRAIECGDDGISAHETAQYRVDGFVSIGNSTGITDTVAAQTSYNRVFIADCIGFDLFFLDKGRYTLTNAIILSSAQNPFTTTGRDDGDCRLTMENVFLRRLCKPNEGTIALRSFVTGKDCTFENLSFKIAGKAEWDHCAIDRSADAGNPLDGAHLNAILASFSDDMRKLVAAHGIGVLGERPATSTNP